MKFEINNEKCEVKQGTNSLRSLLYFSFLILNFALFGCQQKMAEQPAPRAYETSPFFANGSSARPLEAGTVYRGQRPDDHPMVTGLSAEGRKAKTTDATGAAAYDPKSVVPPKGAPDKVENYVSEFPFPITADDLKIGQTRYNTFCGVCHGAAGDGNGKIAERGFLRPPSYHTDPLGKAGDWSSLGDQSKTPTGETGLPQGYSRGFNRWGVRKSLNEVPVGYIFQVITWGYGGMPDHASQITPEDRWRIIAYVRALQLSQGADVNALPAAQKKHAEDALSGKAAAKKDDHGHGH
jgi:mono/diheme cytochrome c family protein